jgi:hypothetical protein
MRSLPLDKVHGIRVPGPGSYGRNDAGDAGIDAALLSKAVGRPVRVQGMRYEGHGWDPKGPASIHRARAALDKDGAVIGYAFESKGFSRIDIDTNESDLVYSVAGQLMGMPLKGGLAFVKLVLGEQHGPGEAVQFRIPKMLAGGKGCANASRTAASAAARSPCRTKPSARNAKPYGR